MKKRYLVLADGTVYEGAAVGAEGESLGELVFTTGMGGYLETLTDPSYYGQIILQTFPLMGNYGVIEQDFEGACAARGYVAREICEAPSNFRCEGTLDAFLKRQGVPGIVGVDTRAITRRIREQGVMNALICDAPPADLTAIGAYAVKGAVSAVTGARREYRAETPRFRVALMDYGAKQNMIRELQKRGCDVIALPADTPAEEILALAPDGIMLSNGPGDPEENVFCIAQIQKLLGKIPMFGICLGHQLMALAAGGKTVKLKYGHRGVNQPVRDLLTGRTYMSSQNHGYAVVADSLPAGASLRYLNANDQTCEGVDYEGLRAFSAQFHPEACSGPRDTAFLFDRFIRLMGGDA